ncbi:hypothetical protein Tco_0913878 [Tanacetum coccineum]
MRVRLMRRDGMGCCFVCECLEQKSDASDGFCLNSTGFDFDVCFAPALVLGAVGKKREFCAHSRTPIGLMVNLPLVMPSLYVFHNLIITGYIFKKVCIRVEAMDRENEATGAHMQTGQLEQTGWLCQEHSQGWVSQMRVIELGGKFTFGKLYEKISFNKELISKGRFFEVNASHKSFSCEVKVEDAQRAIFDIAKVQEAAGFPNMSNFSGKEWW